MDQLREREQRQKFLLRLSDDVRAQQDEAAIGTLVTERLFQHLKLDRCYFARLYPEEDRVIVGPECHRPDLHSSAGEYRLSKFPEVVRRVQGETAVYSDVVNDPALSHSDKSSLQAINIGAFVTASVRRGRERVLWSLIAVSEAPRSWAPGEVTLLEDAAERTWAAVERTRSEAALRESEEKYRSLFATMGQGYAECELLRDADGRAIDFRYVTLNPAFERLFGIAVEAAVGRTLIEVFGQSNPLVSVFDRVVRSGTPEHVEQKLTQLGRWFEVYVYPLGGDRFATLYEDISARKRAEAALRESEERQAFLLKLSDAVRPLHDAHDITGTAARLLAEHLGASRAYYAEWPAGADYGEVARDYTAPGLASLAGRYPIETFKSAYDRIAKGETWVVVDAETDDELDDEERQFYLGSGVRAWVDVPLVKGGDVHAAWCLVQDQPRRWSDEEIGVIEHTAERCWAAIERARAETASRESEERFRTLATTVEDVFYITDLEDRKLDYLSPSYETIWGRPAAELLQDLSEFPDTLHPDDRENFIRGIAVQERGEPVVAEYWVVRPDGEIRYISDRSFPVSGSERKRSAGVAIDITMQKRAEVALRESEERFRLIVESARDYAIFTTDADDVIRDWLPGAENVFGWTRAEAEGQPAAITFTVEDRANGVPEREIATARMEGKATDVRWHCHKDGRLVFIEGQVVPLLNDSGEIEAFLKIGQDVTQRRLAENALRESEKRFRQFGEASSDLLWIRDAETLTFEYLSPAFEALYGVSREQVLTGDHVEQWLDLVHPDDRDMSVRTLRNLVKGVPSIAEFRVVRPDGELRWLQDTNFPLTDENSNVQRIAGIAQDITDRKRAIEFQKTLLAELQHRVRNIMAIMRSIIRRTSRSKADVTEFVDHLEGRVDAMARTQAILTRAPGARVPIEDILREELVSQAAEEMKYRIDGPEVDLSPKTAEVVTLAIHELATNSVKYGALGDPRGTIRVSWSLEANGGPQRVILHWREFGMELTDANRRPGFGTELITRRIPYELRGRGELRYEPTGLQATIEFPLEDRASILQTDAIGIQGTGS